MLAMQIWAEPDKLANLGLTVKDLQDALKDQNREGLAESGRASSEKNSAPFDGTLFSGLYKDFIKNCGGSNEKV